MQTLFYDEITHIYYNSKIIRIYYNSQRGPSSIQCDLWSYEIWDINLNDMSSKLRVKDCNDISITHIQFSIIKTEKRIPFLGMYHVVVEFVPSILTA